jgi:hypothetical protein
MPCTTCARLLGARRHETVKNVGVWLDLGAMCGLLPSGGGDAVHIEGGMPARGWHGRGRYSTRCAPGGCPNGRCHRTEYQSRYREAPDLRVQLWHLFCYLLWREDVDTILLKDLHGFCEVHVRVGQNIVRWYLHLLSGFIHFIYWTYNGLLREVPSTHPAGCRQVDEMPTTRPTDSTLSRSRVGRRVSSD